MSKYVDVESIVITYSGHTPDDEYSQGVDFVLDKLESMPAADVRPVVRGEWVYDEEYCELLGEDTAKCSICGEEFVLDEWGMDDFTNMMHFCSHCGADMREVDDNG